MISRIITGLLICISSTFHPSNQDHIKIIKVRNHRPVIKIITPNSNSVQKWGSQIRYEIRVSDQEDGDSKYREISGSEVYLKMEYEPDPSKITVDTSNADQPDPEGLATIKSSNCSNCHAMRSKVIGPSFSAISQKYPDTQTSIEQIGKHVLNGSSGIWGSVAMPSHPELTKQQAEAAVSWILKNGSNSDLNYLTGLEGVIHLQRPDNATSDGVFILTASYTDHGTKMNPDLRLKGTDVVIITIK